MTSYACNATQQLIVSLSQFYLYVVERVCLSLYGSLVLGVFAILEATAYEIPGVCLRSQVVVESDECTDSDKYIVGVTLKRCCFGKPKCGRTF